MSSFFTNKETTTNHDPFNESNLHTSDTANEYKNHTIPSYKELANTYEQRWLEKKK